MVEITIVEILEHTRIVQLYVEQQDLAVALWETGRHIINTTKGLHLQTTYDGRIAIE